MRSRAAGLTDIVVVLRVSLDRELQAAVGALVVEPHDLDSKVVLSLDLLDPGIELFAGIHEIAAVRASNGPREHVSDTHRPVRGDVELLQL